MYVEPYIFVTHVHLNIHVDDEGSGLTASNKQVEKRKLGASRMNYTSFELIFRVFGWIKFTQSHI